MSQTVKRKRTRNCTKRAKLNSQGFKVHKNFKLYIGKATYNKRGVRTEVLDVLREMWNNDPSFKAMRKHIKELSIRYSNNPRFTGTWDKTKSKIVVNDCGSQPIQEYRSTFVHEGIGHAFWDFSRKYRREELIKFNKLANSLNPVSTYVKNNEKNWRKMNDDNELKISFEKKYDEFGMDDFPHEQYNREERELQENLKTNGHDTMTRYANEQHSAITEIVYGYGGHQTLLNQKDVDQLIALWRELHY